MIILYDLSMIDYGFFSSKSERAIFMFLVYQAKLFALYIISWQMGKGLPRVVSQAIYLIYSVQILL